MDINNGKNVMCELLFNHLQNFWEVQYKLNPFVVDSRQRYNMPFIFKTGKSDTTTKTRNYSHIGKHNINRKFNLIFSK